MSDNHWTYYFTVDHVYDGDTIVGELDLGLGHYERPRRLRLAGINAPSLRDDDPTQVEAAERSLAFLQTLVKAGDYIRVISLHWDKYGNRIDAQCFAVDGTDLSQAMLDSDNAVAYP